MGIKKENQETIHPEEDQLNPSMEGHEKDQIASNDDTDRTEDNTSSTNASNDHELAELKDKYLRLMAEFENFKRRTVREKLETMSMAARDTLVKLLPILDDFDRAKSVADDEQTEETFTEGVTLVYQKLHSIMRQMGLEPMESTGADFDPEYHEAVTEVPAPSDDMKGKNIDTIEKGYTLNDKIIRHAKVVVGK